MELRVIAYTVSVFIRSFTTMKLWNWFAVPALHLEDIGFLTAMGLGLLISHLIARIGINDDESEECKNRKALTAVAAPIFFLIVGFIIHFLV